MTLDEAIKHCEEKAKELSDKAHEEWGYGMTEEEAYDCNECAREHEQLAKWLKELKALKERDRGEWVDVVGWAHLSACKKCGHMIDRRIEEGYPNFCAECGADMRQD